MRCARLCVEKDWLFLGSIGSDMGAEGFSYFLHFLRVAMLGLGLGLRENGENI